MNECSAGAAIPARLNSSVSAKRDFILASRAIGREKSSADENARTEEPNSRQRVFECTHDRFLIGRSCVKIPNERVK